MKYTMGVDLAHEPDKTVFFRRMPDASLKQIGDRIDVAIDVVEDLEDLARRDHAGRQEP